MSINLPKMLAPSQGISLRQGVVTAHTSAGTCTVQIAGMDAVAGVVYLQHVSPLVGETVWLLQNGTDMMVIGKYRPGGSQGVYGVSINEGLEIFHQASTPYIDFHRSADPDASDFNMRIINSGNETLHMYSSAGTGWGTLRVANAKMGSYGWNNAYAHFGHPDHMDANNAAYCLMDGSTETLLSGRTTLHLRHAGNNKLQIHSDGSRFHDWARAMNDGVGFYHQVHGGGWYMVDGLFRIYGDKEIYTNNKIRGQIAKMGDGIWGDHATFGHNNYGPGSNHCGLLQRWDGMVWLRSTNEIIMHVASADLCWFKNSGGWLEMSGIFPMNLCGTAVHVGGDMGGNRRQLGACSSSARWKRDIVDLPDNVSGQFNPVFSMRPRRFFWREDLKTGNGAEVNKWRPEGSTGLITEEIIEVAPEAVSREHDGTPTAPDMYAFFGYLVDAVQYLKTRLDAMGVASG